MLARNGFRRTAACLCASLLRQPRDVEVVTQREYVAGLEQAAERCT
jgi:hypothetical protein